MIAKKTNDQLEITFGENITAAVVEELTDKIKSILEENDDYSHVIANFSNVEYIDSTGITLVIGMYRSVADMKKQFSIIGTKYEIKNLFNIIQLDKIFKIA